MRIKCFGWENEQLSQIKRIREGLINIGYEIVEDNPDIIYCNNDFYDAPLKYSESYPNAKIILNVLDLQTDNVNYDLNKLKEQLNRANKVTCISKSVQKQIKDTINIDSTVIYNPVKDVFHNPKIDKLFPFLYVGRANSENKRFNLIIKMMVDSHWPDKLLKIVGSENPFFGEYGGIVDDVMLNDLYNMASVTLLPSKFEGLGLTAIESLICGTPVIECSDNPTAHEFIPPCMICEPDSKSMIIKIKEMNDNYESFKKIALEYGETYKKQFNKDTIAQNILNLV